MTRKCACYLRCLYISPPVISRSSISLHLTSLVRSCLTSALRLALPNIFPQRPPISPRWPYGHLPSARLAARAARAPRI